MTSEVEERIHAALQSHALERTADGYRLVHPNGAGVSTLSLRPAHAVRDEWRVVAVADIVAEYAAPGLPSFHALGVARLNSMAVHGAYRMADGRLAQTAQYSIYENEPAAHLAAQSILTAFGAQLPIGLSMAMAVTGPAVLEQQRAHHAMPRVWASPPEEAALAATTNLLRQRGLAAANDAHSVWSEVPLSGTCPSRSIDPQAETALLQVNTGVPHPIAGAGYLMTISLPFPQAPENPAEICRRLNALELAEVDFVPRLGAWGLHGPKDVPAYSCFYPTAAPVSDLHTTLIWWCVGRALWLKNRFWQRAAGLPLDVLAVA